MRILTLLLLLTTSFISCTESHDSTLAETTNSTINFSTSNTLTRVTQAESSVDGTLLDVWESGDRVGIYTDGFSDIAASASGYTNEDYLNIEYSAYCDEESDDTYFYAVSDEITYPNTSSSGDSSTVSFWAYYPYDSSAATNGYITFDISNQLNNIYAVDYLAAKSDVEYSGSNTPEDVSFTFSHQLTKVTLYIESNQDLSTLEGLTTEIQKIISKRYYNPLTSLYESDQDSNNSVKLTTVVDPSNSNKATVTAILHPYDYSTNSPSAKISFQVLSRTFEVGFTPTLLAGKHYSYTVALGSNFTGFTSDNSISDWGDEIPSGQLSPTEVAAAAWDGSVSSSFTNGAYDASVDEYTISSGAELALLAELVNGGNDMSNKSFTLTKDIDLNSLEWSIIGNHSTESIIFNGTLDGAGFKITGLKISTNESSYLGLFGCIGSTGIVKNLGISNCTLSSTQENDIYIGGIAGNNDGIVINCYVEGDITATISETDNAASLYVGGLLGSQSTSLINSYHTGEITSTNGSSYAYAMSIVGGTVGANKGSVTNCYHSGAISATAGSYCYMGGVIGANSGGSTNSCYYEESGDLKADGNAITTSGYTAEKMTDDTLLDQLNANISSLNISTTNITPCSWVAADSGYPTLSFSVAD